MLCGSYMHKRQKKANVKTHDEFDNDPIKFCVSNTKRK